MLVPEACRLLHSQGFSSVSLCHYSGFDYGVCVKAYAKARMAPRHALNLRRELAVLSELRAQGVPGVVELLDVGETPDAVLLFFRACPGGNLLHALQAEPWSEARIRDEVALPLAAALARLHAMGTVHRDIKPENVFLDDAGRAVLGDFGLAINAAAERPVSRVGTAGFMAPEVLAAPTAEEAAALPPGWVPAYGCKADVWSLGALLFEALAGRVPFPAPNAAVAALKTRYQPLPPLPEGTSPACRDFVARALEPEPGRRPSAEQLLLHPWLAASPAAARAAAGPGEAWREALAARLEQQRRGAAWREQWAAVGAAQARAAQAAALQRQWQMRGQQGEVVLGPQPAAPAGVPLAPACAGAAGAGVPLSLHLCTPPLSGHLQPAAASAVATASAAAACCPARADLGPAEGAALADAAPACGRAPHRRPVFDSVNSFSAPSNACLAALPAKAAAEQLPVPTAAPAASAEPATAMMAAAPSEGKAVAPAPAPAFPAAPSPSEAPAPASPEAPAAAPTRAAAPRRHSAQAPAGSAVKGGLRGALATLLCARGVAVAAY